jgi:3-(3-hydroxy-phenyl)propionate hydroxylase
MRRGVTDLYDVAIVGFGPVGAGLAALLGQEGVSVLVVDKLRDIYDKPRALALDHEIARVLQGLGLGEKIVPHLAPFLDSRFYGVDGQLIRQMTMLPPPHPLAWTPSMVFMQPKVERLVRERCAEIESIDIRLGVTLERFTQAADGVSLDLVDEAGMGAGARARWLVGCDGASSTVRELAGLSLDDLAFDQAWLVIDVIANAQGHAKLPKSGSHFCEPARPMTFVMGTGDHRRFEIRLLDDEDPYEMQRPKNVWRLLGRWIGPDDATLWRAASYRFHALVAPRWRDRQVLIAGDAAHQQPPYLGQGLCQGMRDAANLAWKLARVLRGQSRADLLDSYTTERSAHARALIQTIVGIGGIVGERDLERARARDARMLAAAGGVVRPEPRQDLMPSLADGCLGRGPGRGTLFPQPMIATREGPRRMDDVQGGGLRVVLGGGAGPMPTPLASRIAGLGGRVLTIAASGSAADALTETEGVVTDWLSRHAAIAAIVRPDHYVFATAATMADLEGAVNELEKAIGV